VGLSFLLVAIAAAVIFYRRKYGHFGFKSPDEKRPTTEIGSMTTIYKPPKYKEKSVTKFDGVQMGQLAEVEDSALNTVSIQTSPMIAQSGPCTYRVVQNVKVALREAADLESVKTTDEPLILGQTFEVDHTEVAGTWGTEENGGPQTFLHLVSGGWAFEFHPRDGTRVCELVIDEKAIHEARKSMYTRAKKELKDKISWAETTIQTANAAKNYEALPGLRRYLDQLKDLRLRLKQLEPKTQSGLAKLLGQQSEITSVAEQCMLLQQLKEFLLSVPGQPEPTSLQQPELYHARQVQSNLNEEFDMGITSSTTITTVATSNISKYSLRQQAAVGKVSGTVAAIRPDTPGATTGPGKLDIRTLHTGDADAADIYSSAKYTVGKLTTGRPEQSAHGLADYMGLDGNAMAEILKQGIAAIRAEFETNGTKEEIAVMRYILDEAAQEKEEVGNAGESYGLVTRDKGNLGMHLKEFLDLPDARTAKLEAAHVAALRIYTSKAFGCINNPVSISFDLLNPDIYTRYADHLNPHLVPCPPAPEGRKAPSIRSNDALPERRPKKTASCQCTWNTSTAAEDVLAWHEGTNTLYVHMLSCDGSTFHYSTKCTPAFVRYNRTWS
jgi:hypothetical protein